MPNGPSLATQLEIDDFKTQLCQINNSFGFHTEVESCITFIKSIKKQQILLIISDSYVSQLLSSIEIFHQINFIFIYYSNKDQYKYFFHEDLNIIGIYQEFHLLISSIEEQIHLINKQYFKWTFFDQENSLTRDLSKQANDFLWIQLFHRVISQFPRDEQARKQMIDACHRYSQGNAEQLHLIDKFEREYESNDAIHWYWNNLFLQKMINKALHTKDIDQLYRLRYFLGDLIENLTREHQQIVQSGIESFIVSHRMNLSINQLNNFKENQGKLMTMKGFLSINSQKLSSPNLSTQSTQRSDLIDVVFEMKCNVKELDDNLVFVDMTQFSKTPCQKEVLFNLNTTFRLESIEQDKQGWIIRMTTVDDGRILTQKLY